MEIQEMRTMLTAGHECGKDVKLWLGTCYEADGTTEHVCDPAHVTNYWRVTNNAGELLQVVFGLAESDAYSNAMRSRRVRKIREKEGKVTLGRMTSEEYSEHLHAEYDS